MSLIINKDILKILVTNGTSYTPSQRKIMCHARKCSADCSLKFDDVIGLEINATTLVEMILGRSAKKLASQSHINALNLVFESSNINEFNEFFRDAKEILESKDSLNIKSESDDLFNILKSLREGSSDSVSLNPFRKDARQAFTLLQIDALDRLYGEVKARDKVIEQLKLDTQFRIDSLTKSFEDIVKRLEVSLENALTVNHELEGRFLYEFSHLKNGFEYKVEQLEKRIHYLSNGLIDANERIESLKGSENKSSANLSKLNTLKTFTQEMDFNDSYVFVDSSANKVLSPIEQRVSLYFDMVNHSQPSKLYNIIYQFKLFYESLGNENLKNVKNAFEKLSSSVAKEIQWDLKYTEKFLQEILLNSNGSINKKMRTFISVIGLSVYFVKKCGKYSDIAVSISGGRYPNKFIKKDMQYYTMIIVNKINQTI